MEVETQPFLNEDGFSEKSLELHELQHVKRNSSLRSWTRPIITHSLVAALVFIAARVLQFRDGRPFPTLYSPLKSVIRYTIDKPPNDLWSNDLYFGPPSEESEIAWNKMIHPHGVQIFPDEAQHFKEMNTVALENGNHLFILGIHHNLHCLRRIRQTLNEDHYYPNMTAEAREHDREHTGHCLEALRTSMLCHPDLTPNRFYWSDRPWHDLSVAPDVTRECIDWSAIENFISNRRYESKNAVKNHGVDYRVSDN